MCLINFAWRSHADYRLVMVANRDEFYARPTKPLHRWDNGLLAGKDLKDGGTWLGILPNGRFAALTNYRDPSNIKVDAPSRGKLVLDYLTGADTPEEYARSLAKEHHAYNGFNLLVGDVNSLYYLNNIDNSLKPLNDGIYGLSNAVLDTPWPKVKKSKNGFTQLMKYPPLTEELLGLFSDTEPAHAAELPSTGVSRDWEHKLSSICIRTPDYGTRSTSVLLIDKQGHITFREKDYREGSDNYLTAADQ